jgi:lysophospholipid acyltransferase (LPLAT)-like uncharacterized protein
MPIVPVAIAATRAKLLKSWDRMIVPLPGARVEVVYGEAIRLERSTPVEEGAALLKTTLNDLEARAEALAGAAA